MEALEGDLKVLLGQHIDAWSLSESDGGGRGGRRGCWLSWQSM